MKEKMSLKGDRLTTKELQRDAPNEGKIVKSDHPGSKKKEMAKKMKSSGGVKSRLEHIRGELRKERISYGEIAELGHKKYRKHLMNDPELAEAAGIPEEEFRKHQKK